LRKDRGVGGRIAAHIAGNHRRTFRQAQNESAERSDGDCDA
jgi:hypothetical protein